MKNGVRYAIVLVFAATSLLWGCDNIVTIPSEDVDPVDAELTIDSQEIRVIPDSASLVVGDSMKFDYVRLFRKGDSIVGCLGYCSPYTDSIKPAYWQDGTAYWIGDAHDDNADLDVFGLHPMSDLGADAYIESYIASIVGVNYE